MFAEAQNEKTSLAQALRPYQAECVSAILAAWERRVRITDFENPRRLRGLAALATGSGKTTILAEVLRQVVQPKTQRALVIAHTREIIFQLEERIRNQFEGELDAYYGPQFAPGIGIVMGPKDAQNARIVVGTRQSLHPERLKEVLRHGAFEVVVIDEAHHAGPDNTYSEILRACYLAYPEVKVIGFTATPKRTDRKALGATFDEIVYTWTILDGIKSGYLVPVTRKKVSTGVDVSAVKTQDGDYASKELVDVLSASNWVDLAVDAYKKYILESGRQAIAFFPQVGMSLMFVQELKRAGIPAAHIDATTPKEFRAQILRDYQAGKLRIVSNMAVLTEGWDGPQTGAILWARPTRSEIVLTQAVGRGLRLYPGKVDCLMVDLTVADTKALQVGTLFGRMITCPECKNETYKGFKTCPTCGADLIEAAKKEEARQKSLGLVMWDGGKGTGQGLHDELVSLFDGMSAAWHKDLNGEIFTCAVGFNAGCMVILPPSYADNEQRLTDRIAAGRQMLGTPLAEDRRRILQSQMARLERERTRIDHYTAYFVSPPDIDGMCQVEYRRANTDLVSLMTEMDGEVLARTESKSMVKRDANWRTAPASDGQLRKLRAIRAKGWSKTMTKGDAAALITHHETIPIIQDWITMDVLAERKA